MAPTVSSISQVKCDFRIAGAAGKRPRVHIVTPGAFQIELPNQRNIQIVTENRDVDLREYRPHIVRLGIEEGSQCRLSDAALGRHGTCVVCGVGHHIVGFVSAADGHLDLPGREIDWNRAVEARAFFLDRIMLSQ